MSNNWRAGGSLPDGSPDWNNPIAWKNISPSPSAGGYGGPSPNESVKITIIDNPCFWTPKVEFMEGKKLKYVSVECQAAYNITQEDARVELLLSIPNAHITEAYSFKELGSNHQFAFFLT